VTVKVGLLFAGCVVILFGLQARGREWRAAAIGAAIVWGVLVVAITELLSLLGGLTHMSLAIFPWIGPATIFQHIMVFGGKGLPRLEGSSL
jgi:hypothetical protein